MNKFAIEEFLCSKYENDPEAFASTCPFCDRSFKTSHYVVKHIQNFCTHPNSSESALTYQRMRNQFLSKKKPISISNPFFHSIDQFQSWQYTAESDGRKQIEYTMILNNGLVKVIKHSEIANDSREGHALARV